MFLSATVHPAAETYANFRRNHLPALLSLREPAGFQDPIPVSERLVQVLWMEQLFDFTQLRTRDGRTLRIIHPGRWNEEGGPDFTGAQVEIDGQMQQGDVEVHLHTGGWNEHGHASNLLYRRVILDVCLWDDGDMSPSFGSGGHPVPQLIIAPHLQSSIDELVESLDPDSYPFSPVRIMGRKNPLQQLSKEQLLNHMAAAGLYRFQQKSLRIAEAIQEHGPDQTAYLGLAEALGYKHNKTAFRQIATTVPLAKIHGLPLEEKIGALLKESSRHRLRVSQVRPANHPERRLAALAILAHTNDGMMVWFEKAGADLRLLRNPPPVAHPFWSWHAHRRSAQFKSAVALVGPARWLEIAVNVVLPFCHAQAAHGSEGPGPVLALYQQLPAASPNLLTRRIAYDLQLAQPRKACLQQGLIQIYQDFDLMLPELLPASA